jgi:TPR repeat protein
VELWKTLVDLGSIVAPTNLGWMYEVGRGTGKDLEKALEWYRKSEEQGYQGAIAALNRLNISF